MAVFNPSFIHELEIGKTKDVTGNEEQNPDDTADNTPEETEDYSLDDTGEPDVGDEGDNADEGDDYNLPTDDTNTDNTTDEGDTDNYELPDDTTTVDDVQTDGDDTTEDADGASDDYSLDDADPDDIDQSEEEIDGGDTFGNDGDETDSSQGNELDQLEDDIFNVMTPEQRRLKELEAKENFSKIYNDINDYIEKINKIPKSDDNLEILEKVISSLLSLKEYVSYYIINTFDTKSYIENNVVYQKYLVSLSAIKNILTEMAKKKD